MEPETLADRETVPHPENPFPLASPAASFFYDAIARRLCARGYPLATAETVRLTHARLIRECCLRAGPPGPEAHPAVPCPHGGPMPAGACAACAEVIIQACRR